MAKPTHWILLRGLSREQQHWGRFFELCKNSFPELTFHCVDLPGCGQHFKEPSPQTVSAIRQKVAERVEHLALPEPYGLIGLSLGGMVALDYLQHSQAIGAVVVINTSTSNQAFYRRLKYKAVGRLLPAMTHNSKNARERAILNIASNCHRDDPAVLARWQTIQRQHPVSTLTIVRQLLAAARFTLPTPPSSNKGLVMCSSKDRLVDYHCSQQIALHYRWPICTHRSAGHELTLDDPEWVIHQFGQWLEQL